jgi:glycosyltransferase involved in cell wall biosynthesis
MTDFAQANPNNRNSLRILMALPKYPYPIVGGLEKQAHELSKTLVSQGCDVHVITSLFDASQQTIEDIDGVNVYRLKWYGNPLFRYFLMVTVLTRRMWLLRKKIDVVHIHQFTLFGVYVQVLSRLLGIPVITKLPNIGKAGIPGIRKRPFGKLQVKILKWADGIVAMNKCSLTELADVSYPDTRRLKITNGIAVDEPKLKDIPKKENSTVRVIFVGRLVEQKGVVTLLQAWKDLPHSAKNKTFLDVYGDGPLLEVLQHDALIAGIAKFVRFNGFSRDVLNELIHSHIFVLPSYVEGNSNAILEAMIAGLPIVATNVGGASIQVGEAGAPFLFEPGDHKTLSNILLKLINDEDLRRQTGRVMRERVLEKFNIKYVAKTYEQAYHLIISGKSDELGNINKGLFDR